MELPFLPQLNSFFFGNKTNKKDKYKEIGNHMGLVSVKLDFY